MLNPMDHVHAYEACAPRQMISVIHTGISVLIIFMWPLRQQRNVVQLSSKPRWSTCTQTLPDLCIDHLYFIIQTTEKCLDGPHARPRRRGLALSRLTCSLWPSWPPPPRDGTSPDVSGYFHFVSKSTLILLALKVNTFSALTFFLQFCRSFRRFCRKYQTAPDIT